MHSCIARGNKQAGTQDQSIVFPTSSLLHDRIAFDNHLENVMNDSDYLLRYFFFSLSFHLFRFVHFFSSHHLLRCSIRQFSGFIGSLPIRRNWFDWNWCFDCWRILVSISLAWLATIWFLWSWLRWDNSAFPRLSCNPSINPAPVPICFAYVMATWSKVRIGVGSPLQDMFCIFKLGFIWQKK